MGFRSTFGALSELVADSITGAAITGGTITGALIQTAAAGRRWVIAASGIGNLITGYTGVPEENTPATIDVTGLGTIGQLFLTGPSMWNAGHSQASGQGTFYVAGRGDTVPPSSEIGADARTVLMHAEDQMSFTSDNDISLTAADTAKLQGSGGGGAIVNAPTASVNLNAGNDVNVQATDQILLDAGTKINATAQLLDLTGGTLNLSGDSISKIRFGSDVVTVGSTVSSATKSVAHGQGTTPDLVLVSAANGVTGYYANVDGYNSTNISLRVAQRDGTVGAASVTVNWLAIWA